MDEKNLLIRRLLWIIWVGPMLFRISSKMEEGFEREHRQQHGKDSTVWMMEGWDE